MTDCFFISSPLHLLMAANLAGQNPQHGHETVVIAKSPQAGARLGAVARQFPDLFGEVLDLSGAGRSAAFQTLKARFARPGPVRVFTGNDRRLEFQYAMHVATASGRPAEGIYLDEGAVTYLGHKSLHRLAHRWLDPAFKKLRHGFWYRRALTTGASAWIQAAYVAFPERVHPLLKVKRLVALDPAPFKTPRFQAVACAMLEGHADYRDLLRGIRVVLALPHEASYIRCPERYGELHRQLRTRFAAPEIAVKAHPRSTDQALLARMFPGAVQLDHAIGMEALLPLLADGCIVAGDISSTLLTTRWLRPDLPVVALQMQATAPAAMIGLYAALKIPLVKSEQLVEWLAALPGPAEAAR